MLNVAKGYTSSELRSDCYHPSELHTFPSQADDWQIVSASNNNAGKVSRCKNCNSTLLALPSSEAPKVYLTWRSCLVCWDSTGDESTHASETGHKSHPIPSLHATAPSSGSEGTGKALARKKGSQHMQNCSDTEQPCSPHLREHHLGRPGKTQHPCSNTCTSEKQEIRFIISLKNLLSRADSANNEILYIINNIEIDPFFFPTVIRG